VGSAVAAHAAHPKDIATARVLARKALLDSRKHDTTRFSVCDHATPVLYGDGQLGRTPAQGRRPDCAPRY